METRECFCYTETRKKAQIALRQDNKTVKTGEKNENKMYLGA